MLDPVPDSPADPQPDLPDPDESAAGDPSRPAHDTAAGEADERAGETPDLGTDPSGEPRVPSVPQQAGPPAIEQLPEEG